jgi:hypothetical protein
MRGQTLVTCSALVLIALASTPATACPWNGCGTDASNAARSAVYYAPPINAYAPPVYAPAYGYMPGPAIAGGSYGYRRANARRALRRAR